MTKEEVVNLENVAAEMRLQVENIVGLAEAVESSFCRGTLNNMLLLVSEKLEVAANDIQRTISGKNPILCVAPECLRLEND